MSETDNESNFDDILEELVVNYENSSVLEPEELDQLVVSYEKTEKAKEKHRQVCKNYYDKHYKIKSNLAASKNAIILQNRALRKKYYQEYYQNKKSINEK